MIFVTAGTTKFPFRRLEGIVRQLCVLFPNKKIVFQNANVGKQGFPKNVNVKSFIPPSKFREYLERADLIVAHAGYATVMQSLEHANCKPLVVPRLKRFGEHVNDHQVYFAKYMERRGLVAILENQRLVKSLVKGAKCNRKQVKQYVQDVKVRRKKLTRFLEGITG